MVINKRKVNSSPSPQKSLLDFLEATQESLIRKFSKSPKQPEPVVFEFTSDKALLHQYYRLRDQIFGRDKFHPGGNHYQEDIYDKISEILVARRGKLLIGACRLTVREGDEGFLLPMEYEDFKIRDLFPDLPLHNTRHGALSKFAILEEHNQRDILYGLCKIMYDRVIALNIHYLFACATNHVLARNWRLIANNFGAKHTSICYHLDVPETPNFPGEKPYWLLSDLKDLCLAEHPEITPAPLKRKLELVE